MAPSPNPFPGSSPNPIKGPSPESIMPSSPARKPKTKLVIDPRTFAELDQNTHEIQVIQAQCDYMRVHARFQSYDRLLRKWDHEHAGTPYSPDELRAIHIAEQRRSEAATDMLKQREKWTEEMKAVKAAKEKLIQLEKAAAAEGKAGAGDEAGDKAADAEDAEGAELGTEGAKEAEYAGDEDGEGKAEGE